jgi:hypothetical protein
MSLKSEKNLEKLGSMPSCKSDTINLVNNRIALLAALREQFLQFDAELLSLVRNAWPESFAANSSTAQVALSPTANDAAKLLGVQGLIANESSDKTKLLITRRVLEAMLQVNADANMIGYEVIKEVQTYNRMNRQKDLAVQLTNVANFYQLGILGITASSLGLSAKHYLRRDGNYVNIVSGYMIAGLALASIIESQHGFWRPGKAPPNVLASAFGGRAYTPSLSPMMLAYLDAPDPKTGSKQSRTQELVQYWKDAKVLRVNPKNERIVEKLSAQGEAHSQLDETMKLISSRIAMLFDLRFMARTSTSGFDQLLQSIQ